MGIKALLKFINFNSKYSIQNIYLTQLAGQTLAVDASIFIYEAKYKMNFNDYTFYHNFKTKVQVFTKMGIKLKFMFDGASPPEKLKTIEKRREHRTKIVEKLSLIEDENLRDKKLQRQIINVCKSDFEDAKRCLTDLKIPIFRSKNEAEASCAKLVKEKKADYVLSNDSDTLVFGSSYIFKKKNVFYRVDLENLLNDLQITQEQFITICVLFGCDYGKSLKKITIYNAVKTIKAMNTLDGILETAPFLSKEELNTFRRSKELFETLGEYSEEV